MLTAEQAGVLEREQTRALKIIYGFHNSARSNLERSGIDTLERRRVDITDKFAQTLAVSDRFKYLFPLRPDSQRRSRHSKKYVEEHAQTSRMYNSPLFYMRRRLNVLCQSDDGGGVAEGSRSRSNNTNTDIRCDFLYDEWR